MNLLTNKYVLIILFLIASNVGFYLYGRHVEAQNAQETSSSLNDKDKQLESLNTQLGVSQSQLVSQSNLNKQLSEENDSLKNQMNEFIKKNNLKVISIDDSIVSVKQDTTGEKNVEIVKATIQNCNAPSNPNQEKISYEWHDQYNRFDLKDPDIFNSNDAIFTASQNFKITGEIFKQKNGKLETRRMVLQEVALGQDANGKASYTLINGVEVHLVDSQFDYTEDKTVSIFHPRAIATFDSNKQFGLGVEFLSWKNVGLNVHNSFDFDNFKHSSLRAGPAYNFNFKGVQTNVGLGASVGTEYQNFFHNYSFSLDLIFYLTN